MADLSTTAGHVTPALAVVGREQATAQLARRVADGIRCHCHQFVDIRSLIQADIAGSFGAVVVAQSELPADVRQLLELPSQIQTTVVIVADSCRSHMTEPRVVADCIAPRFALADNSFEELHAIVLAAFRDHRTRHKLQAELADVRARQALLTSQERAVVRGICNGNKNKAMANRLGVSERTVEDRRRRAYSKFQVTTAQELVWHMARLSVLEDMGWTHSSEDRISS